ncbi:sulfatase-like hydrolase/transferase [Dethiosulfatarculus sandiegensis]|nr:sulfatase-like hydrolase/transferase [Dethiosulfatarculus sandiegensis]
MFRKLDIRVIILVFISGLYPAVLLASNNWSLYPLQEILLLLIGTPSVVFLIGLVLFFCAKIIIFLLNVFLLKSKKIVLSSRLLQVISIFYSFAVMMYLLEPLNRSLLGGSSTLLLPIFLLILVVSFLIYRKKGISPFLLFFAILTVSASIQWGWAYYDLNTRTSAGSWYTAGKDHNDKIQLTKKPNIYLLVLEAYTNNHALQKIYNFDNSKFQEKLTQYGFAIHEDVFSNYRNTLTSLVSLFSMQHHYYSISTGKEDALGAREIIGGRGYNSIVDVLKRNGYSIQYISNSDYCYLIGPPIDYAYPERTIFKVFEVFQNETLNRFLSSHFKTYRRSKKKRKDRVYSPYQDALAVLKERISTASGSHEPYFTFFKNPYPGHFGANWDQISSGDLKDYTEKLKKSSEVIIDLSEYIINKDPNALVIWIGDHGVWRYRSVWHGDGDFHQNLKERDVDEELVSYDLFGTFFAVKTPKNIKLPDGPISHVNLFRYIFTALSDNKYPLSDRQLDESIFDRTSNLVAVKNGQPLSQWEDLKRK